MALGVAGMPMRVARLARFPLEIAMYAMTKVSSTIRRLGRPIFLALFCNKVFGALVGAIYRQRLDLFGLVLDSRSPVVSPVFKSLIFWKLYEHREIKAVQTEMRSDLDVVELGGSIGAVTAHIAAVLEDRRRLITVEPNPALLGQLQKTVLDNTPDCRLTVINAALAYAAQGPSTVEFVVDDNSTLSRIKGIDQPRHATTVRVPAVTLAALLDQYGIDDYVLVCDIEGAEVGFLMSDRDSLARCRQCIIELHKCLWNGTSYSEEDLALLIQKDLGFRLRSQNGPVYVFDRAA
jgi:FkbM family methyltransferase